jgi:hypothetical protein
MNKSGIEVAELYETANLLLRRRRLPVCNGLDFLCRNKDFTCRRSVAKVLYLVAVSLLKLNASTNQF